MQSTEHMKLSILTVILSIVEDDTILITCIWLRKKNGEKSANKTVYFYNKVSDFEVSWLFKSQLLIIKSQNRYNLMSQNPKVIW